MERIKTDSVETIEASIQTYRVTSSVLKYDFNGLEANSVYRVSVSGEDRTGIGRPVTMGMCILSFPILCYFRICKPL